jgi:SAM-dependent methyltransferase
VSSEAYYQQWLRDRCRPGVTALDYCCGNGENGLFMAHCGAHVIGIDISPEGVENANANAVQERVADHCRFEVMDGENMSFPDDTFDVGVVYGALHHVDFDRAMAELARVLTPGAEMICIEALRHNPLIHLYRKMTPHLRTAWEVEHILGVGHLERARRYFEAVDARFFHLAVLVAVPFRKTPMFRGLRRALDVVDRAILRVPWIGRFGWIMVFTLARPRKAIPEPPASCTTG